MSEYEPQGGAEVFEGEDHDLHEEHEAVLRKYRETPEEIIARVRRDRDERNAALMRDRSFRAKLVEK